jgi:hypothetical protein
MEQVNVSNAVANRAIAVVAPSCDPVEAVEWEEEWRRGAALRKRFQAEDLLLPGGASGVGHARRAAGITQ